MVTFSREDVIASCKEFGHLLHVPSGLLGSAVMQAIASNESSLGADSGSRQEASYSEGGRNYDAALEDSYGSASECSHGPWQMMFDNFTPETQAEIVAGRATITDYAQEFVRFFNAYVIRTRHAQTLDQIGEVWNLGHIGYDPEYVHKLNLAYQEATA